MLQASGQKCNIIRLHDPIPKNFIYAFAYHRMIDKLKNVYRDEITTDRRALMKYAFLLVMVAGLRYEGHNPDDKHGLYWSIKVLLSRLTPEEFLATFPPEKRYDGRKRNIPDYFSTMAAIRSLPPNERIGFEIESLLHDYQNNDIRTLVAMSKQALSHIQAKTSRRKPL